MWFPNQHHSHNSVWPRPTRVWCSNLQDKRSSVTSPCELFGKKSSVQRSFSSSRLASGFPGNSEGRFLRSQSMYLHHRDASPGLADRESGFLGACGNSNERCVDSSYENDSDALERWRNAGLALHRMLTKKSPCKQSRSGHSRKRSKVKVEFPSSSCDNVCGGFNNKVGDGVTTSEFSAVESLTTGRSETIAAKSLRTQSFQDFCSVQKNDKDNKIDSFLKISFRQRLLSSSPELEKMFPKMFESLTSENTSEVYNGVICQSPKDVSLISEYNLHSANEPVEQQLSRQLEYTACKSIPRPTSLAISNANARIFSRSRNIFTDYSSVLNKTDAAQSSVEVCESAGDHGSENIKQISDDGGDINVNKCSTQTDSLMSLVVAKPTRTGSNVVSLLRINDTDSESKMEPSLIGNTNTLSDGSYAICGIKGTISTKSASPMNERTQSQASFTDCDKCSTQTEADCDAVSSVFKGCRNCHIQRCSFKSQQRLPRRQKDNPESLGFESSQMDVRNTYMLQCTYTCAFCKSHFDPGSSRKKYFCSADKPNKPVFCELGSCAINNKPVLNAKHKSLSNQNTSPVTASCNKDTTGYSFNDRLFPQSAICGTCNNYSCVDSNKGNVRSSLFPLSRCPRQRFTTSPAVECEVCVNCSWLVHSLNLEKGSGVDGSNKNTNLRSCEPLRNVGAESGSAEGPDTQRNGECGSCGHPDKLDASRQHLICGRTLQSNHGQEKCAYSFLDQASRQSLAFGDSHRQQECSDGSLGHKINGVESNTRRHLLPCDSHGQQECSDGSLGHKINEVESITRRHLLPCDSHGQQDGSESSLGHKNNGELNKSRQHFACCHTLQCNHWQQDGSESLLGHKVSEVESDTSKQTLARGDFLQRNRQKECSSLLGHKNNEEEWNASQQFLPWSRQRDCSDSLFGRRNSKDGLNASNQPLVCSGFLQFNRQKDCSNLSGHKSNENDLNASKQSLTCGDSIQYSRQTDCSNLSGHKSNENDLNASKQSLTCGDSIQYSRQTDCSNLSGHKSNENYLNGRKQSLQCGDSIQYNRRLDCSNLLDHKSNENDLNGRKQSLQCGDSIQYNRRLDCSNLLGHKNNEAELDTSRPLYTCEDTLQFNCRQHDSSNSLSECQNGASESDTSAHLSVCNESHQSSHGLKEPSNKSFQVHRSSEGELDTSNSQFLVCDDILKSIHRQDSYSKHHRHQIYENDFEKMPEIVNGSEIDQSMNSSSEKCPCMCERCQTNEDVQTRETIGGDKELQSREVSGGFQSLKICRESKGVHFSDRRKEYVNEEFQPRETSGDFQSRETSRGLQSMDNCSQSRNLHSVKNSDFKLSDQSDGHVGEFQSGETSGDFQSMEKYGNSSDFKLSDQSDGHVGEFQSGETSGDFQSMEKYGNSSDFKFSDRNDGHVGEFQSRETSGDFQSMEKYGNSSDFKFSDRNDGHVGEFQSRETSGDFQSTDDYGKEFQSGKTNTCTVEKYLQTNDGNSRNLSLKPSNYTNADNRTNNSVTMETNCVYDHHKSALDPIDSTNGTDRKTNLHLQVEDELHKQTENASDDRSVSGNHSPCPQGFRNRLTESDDADCDSASAGDGYYGNRCGCSSRDSTFCDGCDCVTMGKSRDLGSRSEGQRRKRKKKKIVHGRKTFERKAGSSSSSCEVEQAGLSDENAHEYASEAHTVDPFSNTMLQLYFARGQYEDDDHELNETKESSADYDKSFSVYDTSLGFCASASLELSPLKDIFSNPLSPSQPVNDFPSVLDVSGFDPETSVLLDKGADNSSGTGVEKIDRSESAGSVSRMIDEIFSPFETMIRAQGSDVSDTSSQSDKVSDFFRAPNFDLPSSDSGDADDEFECDCEHCQLVRVSTHPDQLSSALTSVELGDLVADPQQITNPWEAEWVFSGDNNFDISLDDFRPLEPFLQDLQQQLPQDPIELMYQNVIMQMLTVHPELLGELAPPPVSLTVIDSLEVVLASKENTGPEMKCPICLCWFDEGEELTQLPCQHLYHPLCIQAWLVKSGTCPVCRHVLQPDL